MMRPPRIWAGSKNVVGVGWSTVAYEIAIERVLDSDEDSAAPIVPDERARAARQRNISIRKGIEDISQGYRQDVLRPRFGPDI
jgi:hypothetical protein